MNEQGIRDSKVVTTRIAMIVTDYDSVIGGLQIISRNLLQELNRRGCKTYVCCRNYRQRPRNESVNETLVHRSPTFRVFSSVLNSLSFLFDSLWWLCRNRKNYDVIHCQQIFAPAMIGALAKIFLRKSFIVGVHSTGSWGEVNELKNSPLRFLHLRFLKAADAIVALNQDARLELEDLGIESDKICFVPNGTKIPDEATFQMEVKKKYREKLNLPYDKIAVFTGRLSAEKGLDVLVKAWEKIYCKNSQAHLLIIGKGGGFPDVEAETKQLCRELNLQNNIHFRGFQPNPIEYLLASDVFVSSSHTECFGLSIVEAMASGTPIVATETSGAKALIDDGKTGKLVPIKDFNQLAAAITKIFESSGLSDKLGRAAREKAVKKFSVEAMGDQYLDLYSKILSVNKSFTFNK